MKEFPLQKTMYCMFFPFLWNTSAFISVKQVQCFITIMKGEKPKVLKTFKKQHRQQEDTDLGVGGILICFYL